MRISDWSSDVCSSDLTTMRRIDWDRVFRVDRPQLAMLAAVLLAGFAVLRIWTAYGTLPDPVMQRFAAHGNRGEFGLIYLLNFAALAYLLTWLIRVGRASPYAAVRRLGGLLRSEERRVGTGCVSTGRSRWSPEL